jgi:uncharacterized membrane protein YkoI
MMARIATTALVLAAALLAAAPALAVNRLAVPPGHFESGARAGVSLAEAVEQVRADTGGRVLSAETVRKRGRAVHRIKVLLPSGHVRTVQVDAGGE